MPPPNIGLADVLASRCRDTGGQVANALPIRISVVHEEAGGFPIAQPVDSYGLIGARGGWRLHLDFYVHKELLSCEDLLQPQHRLLPRPQGLFPRGPGLVQSFSAVHVSSSMKWLQPSVQGCFLSRQTQASPEPERTKPWLQGWVDAAASSPCGLAREAGPPFLPVPSFLRQAARSRAGHFARTSPWRHYS